MRKSIKIKAWALLTVMLSEIIVPPSLMALTSGPSQPEMAGFEPYGTTELVDPFTGDFTYNIPLMDIEGYPVNMSYSSGIGMEQEASWVGLGWNLNVGTINRSVRGLPDDFNGDEIISERNMKDMEITTAGLGASLELFGKEGKGFSETKIASGSGSISFTYNNYKGLGMSLTGSAGPKLDLGGGASFSPSLGFSMNSLEGTSFNSSLGLSFSKENSNYNFGGNLGSGFNTRTGKVMLSLGTTAGYSEKQTSNTKKTDGKNESGNSGGGTSGSYSWMPVGMETFTPYPSFPMETQTISFSGSVGGEFTGFNLSGKIFGSRTVQKLTKKTLEDKSYGYLYSENANNKSLQDFNKPKPVQLNKTVQFLSPVNYTYDVFSVSGQGVGGMFRPFRNDLGVMGNPNISYSSSKSGDFGAELGFGSIFKAGVDISLSSTDVEYGKWNFNGSDNYEFTEKTLDSPYENVYFKAAGELSQSDISNFLVNGGYEAVAFEVSGYNTSGKLFQSKSGSILDKLHSRESSQRMIRSKSFSILTAQEATHFGLDTTIKSYKGKFYNNSLEISESDRISEDRKKHHISEIVQINPNGERYVYGIPAYNHLKKEVSFSVDSINPQSEFGRVGYDDNADNTVNNLKGLNNFYSATETPDYSHSFLLTGKLSADYEDVTGDGISDDDLGQAYKFNYTKTSDAYKWRIPYNNADFQAGYQSDVLDQKASYTYGEKELWYVHSIESKNQVAEFYISPRKDGLGTKGENGGLPDPKQAGRPLFWGSIVNVDTTDLLYRLDSIVLFQKYDRLKNKENAVPIKRVVFDYDYSLCKDPENSIVANNPTLKGSLGKLTLKEIHISYGKNYKGALSPYSFKYGNINPDYDPTAMDRWGNYKPKHGNPGNVKNQHYPYSTQHMLDSVNDWASAWHLEQIITPSGGKINIEYESDDYAFVQDRPAMQMYAVKGAGTSSSYTSNLSLYNNDYIYIERPPEVDTNLTQAEIKKLLFGNSVGLNNMYFKFNVNIQNNLYEDVSGYVDVLDAGLCDSNKYMFIQLKPSSPNSITNSAWDYFRFNLMNVLYDQPNINDSGIESIIKGLAANVADIKQMFTGVEDHLESKGVAKYFNKDVSMIRLFNMTGKKMGGGTRVKKISLNDSWKDMVNEGENSKYGQEYIYTTKDELGNTISSGVASYEPMIGNEENPFREPIPYVAAARSGHIPAIDAFQETPITESFFPSPSVGYSKVLVKDINNQKSRTARAVTEHQFYTAKDFPVIVKNTDIDQDYLPAKGGGISYPFSNQTKETKFVASQGYSIMLNDMHGKPRSTVNYFYEELGDGFSNKKPLSGTEYEYHTKSGPEGTVLNNEVDVLTRSGKKEKMLLGVEYDMAIASEYSYQKSSSSANKLGIDLFLPGGFLPILFSIPSAWGNGITDIQSSKTVVTTKVIQSYGILKSVRKFTDQHSITTSNELYDGRSGEVLLTKTRDEYNNEEYQFKMPAYLISSSQRMGPAIENIGMETSILPSNDICNFNRDVYRNPGFLKHGDKVAVYREKNNYLLPDIVWVNVDVNENNKKEESLCAQEKEFAKFITRSTTRSCICDHGSSYINSGEMFHSANLPLSDTNIIAFHLNSKTSDQLDSFINDYIVNNGGTFKDFFRLHSTPNDYTPSNCSKIIKHFLPNRKVDINAHSIDSIFDLSDTIFGITRIYNPTSYYINEVEIKIQGNQIKYVEPGQLLLVKQYDKDTVPEYYIRLLGFNDSLDVAGLNFNPNIECSEGNYTLVDRNGNRIDSLTNSDYLKVIRSGNRNMQSIPSGIVTSLEDPLQFNDSGIFVGIKTSQDINILLANSTQYSDSYILSSEYYPGLTDTSKLNKFLYSSDGKFQIVSSSKYLADRKQSNEVNTGKDGYYDTPPSIWTIDTSSCSFILNPPEQSGSSGWFNIETVKKYTSGGQAIESENILGIESGLILGKNGGVKAVGNNADASHILIEDFEDYKIAVTASRNYRGNFGILKREAEPMPLISIPGSLDILETDNTDHMLVQGVSHTGEYSMFLKAIDPNPNPNIIQYEFTETPTHSLETYEIGSIPNTPTSIVNLEIDYSATDQKNKDELLANMDPDQFNLISFTAGDSIYERVINDSMDLLSEGEYYISGWVKDMANSATAFKGFSPKINLIVGANSNECSISPEIINGWQKFELNFTIPDSTSLVKLRLEGGLWGAFFDDIRIHPFQCQMSSYVYCNESGKVKAKLDENNYAVIYEYDEEGIPSQVKRETSEGIFTISESRQSLNKHIP